jgi:Zn-dependent protease
MHGGYVTIGRWRRAPIRIHWSALLGALVWTGGDLSLPRCLTFVAIILVHELGHALLVRRARASVVEIRVHFMGGECQWAGRVSPLERSVIAFGGVWAQLLLALGAVVFARVAPPTMMTRGAMAVLDMLTSWNLFNAAFNLLPIAPLDGAEAWKLFPRLYQRLRLARLERKRARNRRDLRAIEGELEQLLDNCAKRSGSQRPD